MGLFLGYSRAAAARYSFLLAIPAVLGSGFFQAYEALTGDIAGAGVAWGPTILATVIAFGVGLDRDRLAAALPGPRQRSRRSSSTGSCWACCVLALVGAGVLDPTGRARRAGAYARPRDHRDPAPPRPDDGERRPASWPAGPPACGSTRPGQAQVRRRGRAAGAGAAGRRRVSSPLERCQQTAGAVLAGRELELQTDDRLGECPLRRLDRPADQGAGQGAAVEGRAAAPVGRGLPRPRGRGAGADPGPRRRRRPGVERPARARTPSGWPAATATSSRRSWPTRSACTWTQFQRIVVDPASISVVSYTETRPFVLRVNDTGGDVAALIPPPKTPPEGLLGRRRRRRSRHVGPDLSSRGGRRPGRRVTSTPCHARSFLFERPAGSSPAPSGQPGDRTFYLQAVRRGRPHGQRRPGEVPGRRCSPTG